MLDNNLSVDFFPTIKIEKPIDYLALRIRQTHDMWHILTGFDTSVEGEVGLQAFMLAQTKSPLAALIISAGSLHVLTTYPENLSKLYDCIQRGWGLGKSAKFLLGFKLEQMWSEDLQKLRRDFALASAL
jgi:ubiquinone biosynthesis protein Coq4